MKKKNKIHVRPGIPFKFLHAWMDISKVANVQNTMDEISLKKFLNVTFGDKSFADTVF